MSTVAEHRRAPEGCTGYTPEELVAAGAEWTAREISQQPEVWQQVGALVERERAGLAAFLEHCLADPALRIVLSGAGTSAFLGACLAPALARQLARIDAIATTDLVTDPTQFLRRELPTLLVSFARSGNSPESVAAAELVEEIVADPRHLVITCNADGALAGQAARLRSAHALVLPDATNDRGFAMTSSFTSMLLAAALAFGLIAPSRCPELAVAARTTLERARRLAPDLVARRFERVAYLGSNELRGLASEAALKMLELTDGRTVAVSDSVLGFRHGPKTIINDRTLVVLWQSNDPYTRAYDDDLRDELVRDGRAGAVLTVGAGSGNDHLALGHLEHPTDLETALLGILFAQVLALHQSLALGITPDRPNAAGVVNRVVQGVTIHRWRGEGHVSRR